MASMIYELAVVEDRGTYWKVANVTKNTLDNLANRDEKMLKLSYSVYQIIQTAIMEGKIVKISKTLSTDEVQPWEVDVVDVAAFDELQAAKDAAIVKVRMLVTPEMSRIAGMTLYGFMILNNDLVAAGYPITNDNREEQYLKMLETGDEKLIAKLEEYLNYRDEIENVANIERRFSTFRTNIKTCETVEDVIKLEQHFLERFYVNS